MSTRLVVLAEEDEVARGALEDLRVRKDPKTFARRSIEVGERIGLALREREPLISEIDPPVYYKLRDARYVWHGFHMAVPNAAGIGIFTSRTGTGYSSVDIQRDVEDVSDPRFTAFLDPMLARGTTALAVSEQIIRARRFRRYATMHCFAAEEGIANLQTRLSDFCDDYLLMVGMRGFHVDQHGYMGAIRREMDWGDVQDGTYFFEYPAEKEIEIVRGELATSGGLDILMATVLLLLQAHEQNHRAVNRSDPAIPSDGWVHTMLCLLKEEGYPVLVPAADWDFTHFYPRSSTVGRALTQLKNEDMVSRFDDEKYPTYALTGWGREYLGKVYVPVLALHDDGFFYQLVDAVQTQVERSIALRFGSLARTAKVRRNRLRPLDRPNV